MSYRLATPPKIEDMEVVLSEDRSRVTAGGTANVLDAKAMDHLLLVLGMWRAKMLPPVAETRPTGALVGIRAKIFGDSRADLTGEPILQVRDAGLGWLNYLRTHDQARELGEKLIAQADAPLPPTAGSA
jgi:hypothetical protein